MLVDTYIEASLSLVAKNPSITFDDAYPSWLEFPYSGTNSSGSNSGIFYEYINEVVILDGKIATLTNTTGLAADIPELLGAHIFAFYLVQRNKDTFTKSYIESTIGPCYYCSNTSGYNDYIIWYRLTRADIDPDWSIVGSGIGEVDTSSSIGFLASFGQNILGIANGLLDIVSFDVGGKPLFYWLVGSGFLVFAGMIVVKWFLP